MYTLVKKVKTEGEFSKSETYAEYDKAVSAFHLHMHNNIEDKNVKRIDVVILNNTLMPIKDDHFSREDVSPVAESEETE